MERASITELTREEFLEFIRIVNEPKKTEREARRRIRKADGLSEHFRKNGLLFYPAPDCGSDEAVQEEAGTWRRDNGLPGFRTP